jgi:hypothetical protein
MKKHHILALLAALIIAPFAALGRALFAPGTDALNTQGTHGGVISRKAEGAITAHLLVTFGTAPGSQVKLCTAATRPLGFAYDKAADGADIAVELITGGPTRLAIGSKAIAAGVRVYATAGGKLTDAVVAGAFLVGESLTACGADGDEFEIMPLSPVENPA